jgi:hypothetical protein
VLVELVNPQELKSHAKMHDQWGCGAAWSGCAGTTTTGNGGLAEANWLAGFTTQGQFFWELLDKII